MLNRRLVLVYFADEEMVPLRVERQLPARPPVEESGNLRHVETEGNEHPLVAVERKVKVPRLRERLVGDDHLLVRPQRDLHLVVVERRRRVGVRQVGPVGGLTGLAQYLAFDVKGVNRRDELRVAEHRVGGVLEHHVVVDGVGVEWLLGVGPRFLLHRHRHDVHRDGAVGHTVLEDGAAVPLAKGHLAGRQNGLRREDGEGKGDLGLASRRTSRFEGGPRVEVGRNGGSNEVVGAHAGHRFGVGHRFGEGSGFRPRVEDAHTVAAHRRQPRFHRSHVLQVQVHRLRVRRLSIEDRIGVGPGGVEQPDVLPTQQPKEKVSVSGLAAIGAQRQGQDRVHRA